MQYHIGQCCLLLGRPKKSVLDLFSTLMLMVISYNTYPSEYNVLHNITHSKFRHRLLALSKERNMFQYKLFALSSGSVEPHEQDLKAHSKLASDKTPILRVAGVSSSHRNCFSISYTKVTQAYTDITTTAKTLFIMGYFLCEKRF